MKKHLIIIALFTVNSIFSFVSSYAKAPEDKQTQNLQEVRASKIDSFVSLRENLYEDYEEETMKRTKDRDEIIKKLTNVVNFDNLLIIDAQKRIKQLDSTLEATQYNYNNIREKYSKFESVIKGFEKFTLILYASIGAETLLLLIFIIILYSTRRKLKKVRFALVQAKQSLENSETEKASLLAASRQSPVVSHQSLTDDFELNLNKLEKLKQLKESNILNEEEFLKLKQKILDKINQ